MITKGTITIQDENNSIHVNYIDFDLCKTYNNNKKKTNFFDKSMKK
jgi:hypothetical protein